MSAASPQVLQERLDLVNHAINTATNQINSAGVELESIQNFILAAALKELFAERLELRDQLEGWTTYKEKQTAEREALKAELDSLTDAHASLALQYGQVKDDRDILRSTEKHLREQAALDRAVIDDLLKEQDIFIRTLGRLTEEEEDEDDA